MPRDLRRRAALIREADELLDAACQAMDANHTAAAIRATAEAGDRFHRAGLGLMAANAQAFIARLFGCHPSERRWTPRMVEVALTIETLTAAAGRPPSWKELARAMRVTIGAVKDVAASSQSRGLLTRQYGQPRTLMVNRMEAG